ncbi:hypothetical protein ACXGQW_04905 [Wenyingzhuangia sp. IMCC45533]
MVNRTPENKKRFTQLLVVLVIVIWGVFFIKIFNFYGDEQVINYVATPVEKILLRKKIQVEKIQLSYDDPFGMIVNKKIVKRKPVAVKKKSKPKRKIIFPTIIYNGFIGSNSDIKFYVVTIRGKQHYLKLNQDISEVKLVEGNAKSISFLKDGEIKSFLLSK